MSLTTSKFRCVSRSSKTSSMTLCWAVTSSTRTSSTSTRRTARSSSTTEAWWALFGRISTLQIVRRVLLASRRFASTIYECTLGATGTARAIDSCLPTGATRTPAPTNPASLTYFVLIRVSVTWFFFRSQLLCLSFLSLVALAFVGGGRV